MTTHKKILIASAITTVIGATGFLPGAYYWYRDRQLKSVVPAQVSAEPLPAPTRKVISGQPIRLSIPSLSIDLTVAEGAYNQQTKEWTLSTDKAHYADITPQPNDYLGNTLIYGHYRPEVFAYLHNIQPGAQVTVHTQNGYKFVYKYRDNKVTDPSDTSLFDYRGKPILTLQTCTGAWMQNRQLFTFDFVKATK